MAGGLVFEWADEWFKTTWNTRAHQIPADRRQLWHDPLTNEQYFGMIATDATGHAHPKPIALTPASTTATGAAAVGAVGEVIVRIDESYLRLDITVKAQTEQPLTIGLDTLPDLTGPAPAGSPDTRADVELTLNAATRDGRLWLRHDLDPVPLDYPAAPSPTVVDGWVRSRMIINRDRVAPSTGRRLPAEMLDISRLDYGTWDGDQPDSDSGALWNRSRSMVRVRIPWAMAGFAAPSSHQVLTPKRQGHTTATPGVGLTVTAGDQTSTFGTITWPKWQRVGFQERLKTGADTLRTALVEAAQGATVARGVGPP